MQHTEIMQFKFSKKCFALMRHTLFEIIWLNGCLKVEKHNNLIFFVFPKYL